MEKTTLFSVIFLVLFIQWQSIPVESANTTEAKVIRFKPKIDNGLINLVKDNTSISGWALEVNKQFDADYHNTEIYVFFGARDDQKTKFKHVLFGHLCYYIHNEKDEEYKNFVGREILHMLFIHQKGSCLFNKGQSAIPLTGRVHPDLFDVDSVPYFPKKTPYEMAVRIADWRQLESLEYYFQIDFAIGGSL